MGQSSMRYIRKTQRVPLSWVRQMLHGSSGNTQDEEHERHDVGTLAKIPSADNCADFFTKGLGATKFQFFCKILGIIRSGEVWLNTAHGLPFIKHWT